MLFFILKGLYSTYSMSVRDCVKYEITKYSDYSNLSLKKKVEENGLASIFLVKASSLVQTQQSM